MKWLIGITLLVHFFRCIDVTLIRTENEDKYVASISMDILLVLAAFYCLYNI